MSAEKANQLDKDIFERWQELKREELAEEGRDNMEEIQERNSEVLDAFSKGTEDELTKEIEVYGQDLEILIDLSDEQINLLKDIDSTSKDDLSDISVDKADSIAEKLITLLVGICVDNGEVVEKNPGKRGFWEIFYEQNSSVLKLYTIVENILVKWKKFQEKGKKFRG